jgi:hypothetical protein
LASQILQYEHQAQKKNRLLQKEAVFLKPNQLLLTNLIAI